MASDPLARAGLTSLLAELEDLEIRTSATQAEVVLWDVGWGDPVFERAEIPIVALVAEPAQAHDAWLAGARGIVSREADPPRIAAALRAVVEGLATIDPEYERALLREPGSASDQPFEALTGRELEVLELLAEGLSNRAIALRLEISEHTVKFHVNAILRKLGAQSRTDAVVRATRMGLILL